MLVLFGATGDLARKKLHPALYRLSARGRLGVPVVGVARSAWTDDQLRAYAREAVRDAIRGGPRARSSTRSPSACPTSAATTPIRPRTSASGATLAAALHPVFYLAIPPSMFDPVIGGLMAAGLHEGAASSSRSRSGATSPRRGS